MNDLSPELQEIFRQYVQHLPQEARLLRQLVTQLVGQRRELFGASVARYHDEVHAVGGEEPG